MSLTIELRPQIAVQEPPHKPIRHPQCQVFVNGKQVGIYCGRELEPAAEDQPAVYEKGKFLSFINTVFEVATELGMPYDDLIKQTVEEINKLIGGTVGKVAYPPAPFGEQVDFGTTETVIGADLG